ncbi:hypothetical protein [Embleya sp. MST-111070]|uniref:hypothetical protein n=1 Tax=Embleya sp. MST-111070 TaxID=3398231 RepID=UPI003F734B45
MTAIRVRNVSSAVEPAAPPVKDDGTPYRFELIHDGGRERAYADTVSDLLDVIIPNYSTLTSPKERAAARIRLALRLQVHLQAGLAAVPELDQCTEQQRSILLASRETPPTVTHWDAPVPLVLVTSFYRPAGRLPRPQGPDRGLIWIDPGDDWNLLLSLHSAGVIVLSARAGAFPTPNATEES